MREQYEPVVSFSISKPPLGWAPFSEPSAPDPYKGWRRTCRETCVLSDYDPQCYVTQEDCECDRAGGKDDPDGERCAIGRWCVYETAPNPTTGTDGVVCPQCCIDSTMFMWDTSDPEFKANSFVPGMLCNSETVVTALNGPGGATCACNDPTEVRCAGQCKKCSTADVSRDSAGNVLKDEAGAEITKDCTQDINVHCGIDPATCDCIDCLLDTHEIVPGGSKWCCPKCEGQTKRISRHTHRISEPAYSTIINDKTKACLCCPEPPDDSKELDVTKLPDCEWITKRYKCVSGGCVQKDDGPYASRKACLEAGCEDYECYTTVRDTKKCGLKNKNRDEGAAPGEYRTDEQETAKEKCEKDCKGWVCTGAADPWMSCCLQKSIKESAEPHVSLFQCVRKEEACRVAPQGKLPCLFPLERKPDSCDCKCVNGNNFDLNNQENPCGDQGPQGPVPPGGGGGGGTEGGTPGGGTGGDGGGGDGSSVSSCGTNASRAADGNCYCNYPSAIAQYSMCSCPGWTGPTSELGGAQCPDYCSVSAISNGVTDPLDPDIGKIIEICTCPPTSKSVAYPSLCPQSCTYSVGKCTCADGYVTGTPPGDGGDPPCISSTGTGGGDGIGGTFMPPLKFETVEVAKTESAEKSICEDVICPPKQCCNETVFGFECRAC